MKRASTLAVFCALSVFFGCVTVNVTFPEAAVQQATDDYVQSLYKEKEKGRAQPSPKPGAEKRASLDSNSLLDFIIPRVEAAQDGNSGAIKISVDSPKAAEIRQRQVTRLDAIAKAASDLGETNMGLLSVMSAPRRQALQPLVDAENQDRKTLYNEILASNGYASSRLVDLQKSFARSFQAHAPAGMWVQDDGGKWTQKR